jgi:hypothetical protein
MLEMLFGKKCDHPMADLKSAQAALSDLPKNDALKAIMFLSDSIESVGNHPNFKPNDQFAVLNFLEETSNPFARKLSYEYFTLPDMNGFQGNRLCIALEGLYRNLVNAYFTLFQSNCIKPVIKPQLLAVKVIITLREQLKYTSAQYKPFESQAWDRFAHIFQHAEQQRYLDTPLLISPTQGETTTIMSESVKLLVWNVCDIYSQPQRNMYLTERIISQHGKSIAITPNYNDHTMFGFDLTNPTSPFRINQNTPHHPTMRYFSLAEMKPGVESLIQSLEKHSVPPELYLRGFFPTEHVLDAAKRVLTYVVSPPIRNSKRMALSVIMDVVKGYDNTLIRCREVIRDERTIPSMQWTVENVSTNGFLAVTAGRPSESIQIGNLLGIQSSGTDHIGVAVARNLIRDAEGNLRVGAEILATQASEVKLQLSAGHDGSSGSGRWLAALWLHTKDELESGTTLILLRPESFSMQRSMQALFQGKNFLLIPHELKKSDTEFVMARYRVVEQEVN